MEEKPLRVFSARVRISKSNVAYTSFLGIGGGFHVATEEVCVEAESPLSAKLIIERQYGKNSCASFPVEVSER